MVMGMVMVVRMARVMIMIMTMIVAMVMMLVITRRIFAFFGVFRRAVTARNKFFFCVVVRAIGRSFLRRTFCIFRRLVGALVRVTCTSCSRLIASGSPSGFFGCWIRRFVAVAASFADAKFSSAFDPLAEAVAIFFQATY